MSNQQHQRTEGMMTLVVTAAKIQLLSTQEFDTVDMWNHTRNPRSTEQAGERKHHRKADISVSSILSINGDEIAVALC